MERASVENPQHPALEVGLPVHRVHELGATVRTERQRKRVDRKISPQEILFQVPGLDLRESGRMAVVLSP